MLTEILNKKVFVIPVPRKSVQGRSDYDINLSTGERISANRTRARNAKVRVKFTSPDGFKLKTGLDEVVDNPFYGLELDQIANDIRPRQYWASIYNEEVKDRKTLPLQTLYEIIDDQPKNSYTSVKNLRPADAKYNNGKAPTVLEDFALYLDDNMAVFNGNTSRGRLAILLLENHPKVAKSREEANVTKHEFYLASDDEATARKKSERSKIMETMANTKDLTTNYDKFTRFQVASILNVVKDKQIIETKVDNELEEFVFIQKSIRNGGTQEERHKKFNELYDLVKAGKDGKIKLYIKYMFKQALNYRIIVNSNAEYLWLSKKDHENVYRLGRDLDKIHNMFHQEYINYNPDIDEYNWYKELEEELVRTGITTQADL